MPSARPRRSPPSPSNTGSCGNSALTPRRYGEMCAFRATAYFKVGTDQQEGMARCVVDEEWDFARVDPSTTSSGAENCANDADDDGDGFVDCFDFDCGASGVCPGGGPTRPYCWTDPDSVQRGGDIDQPCCGMTAGGDVEYRVSPCGGVARDGSTAQFTLRANAQGCTSNTWSPPLAFPLGVYLLTSRDASTGRWSETVAFRVDP